MIKPQQEEPSLGAGEEVSADKEAEEAHSGQDRELEVVCRGVWVAGDVKKCVHIHREENHQDNDYKPGNTA